MAPSLWWVHRRGDGPKGRTMGHAGAIVSGEEESAEAKKAVMRECGIHVVDSPAQIGSMMVGSVEDGQRLIHCSRKS